MFSSSPVVAVSLFMPTVQMCSSHEGRCTCGSDSTACCSLRLGTALLGLCLLAMTAEALYTILKHIKRRNFRRFPPYFLAAWWMSCGSPIGWAVVAPLFWGWGRLEPHILHHHQYTWQGRGNQPQRLKLFLRYNYCWIWPKYINNCYEPQWCF